MEKQKILILGSVNVDIGKSVTALLKQLDKVMVVDVLNNAFELTIHAGHNETIDIITTPPHCHGWYRKFEKNSKKRNFKKGI